MFAIDRIVSRTVVYVLLTAFVVGTYILGVLVVGQAVSGGRRPSSVIVAGTTLQHRPTPTTRNSIPSAKPTTKMRSGTSGSRSRAPRSTRDGQVATACAAPRTTVATTPGTKHQRQRRDGSRPSGNRKTCNPPATMMHGRFVHSASQVATSAPGVDGDTSDANWRLLPYTPKPDGDREQQPAQTVAVVLAHGQQADHGRQEAVLMPIRS